MPQLNDRAGGKEKYSAVGAVDLFCGAGGLTHGLRRAGLSVYAGIDLDPECEFPFQTNNAATFICTDIASLSVEDLRELFPETGHRVVAGCAPCQPFSRYTRARITKDYQGWGLLNHFLRLAKSLRPAVITMENVPEIQRDAIFKNFVRQLHDCSYTVTYANIFCPDYGVPQRRTRLVLFASLYGAIALEPPTHAALRPTVRSAISHLPNLRAGGVHFKDVLHRSSRLTHLNMQRILNSKPGGCWRDWPHQLVARCHREKSGATYPSVYGRMEWDQPSPTITTQFFGYGNGRFGHPVQNRALSLREGAILQSFPDDYAFQPHSTDLSFVKLGRMIGNAVPVRLGEVIGNAIIRHLEGITS